MMRGFRTALLVLATAIAMPLLAQEPGSPTRRVFDVERNRGPSFLEETRPRSESVPREVLLGYAGITADQMRSVEFPVLLPPELMLAGRTAFYPDQYRYAATIEMQGAQLEVLGTREGFVLPRGAPAVGGRVLGATEILRVETSEAGIDLSLTACGAAYSISILCDDPAGDVRCTDENAVRYIAGTLVELGGTY
jgi:hypothetical protein